MTLKTEALKELNRRKLNTINEIKDLDELKNVRQTEIKDITDNKVSVEEDIETLKSDMKKVQSLISEEKNDLEYLDDEILTRKTTIGFLEQKIKQKEERLQSLQHDIEKRTDTQNELDLEIKKNINYLDTIETKKVDVFSKSKEDKNYTFTIEFDNGTVQSFAVSDLQDAYLIRDVSQDDLNKWIEDSKIPTDVFEDIAKDNEPLPKNLYIDYEEGKAWSQFHISGLEQEEVKAYEDGNISLATLLLDHPVHCDLRMKFGDKFIEWTIVHDNIPNYFNTLLGRVDQETGKVSKGLAIVKLEEDKLDDETIINENDAELLANTIMMDKSYFIEPGEVGATTDKYALMGTIWIGKVKSGVQRVDGHEYFLYPNKDISDENKELFNGKFLARCFKTEESKFWCIWKCNPKAMDSIDHSDTGDYYPVKASEVEKFGNEAYKEESKCKFVNK